MQLVQPAIGSELAIAAEKAVFVLPSSHAQKRLWILTQLDPASPAYHIGAAFHASGELDVRKLQASLAVLVLRHESLRTAFMFEGGEPVQVVSARCAIEVPVADLSGLNGVDRHAVARLLADKVRKRPFELSEPGLLRVVALKLTAAEHFILFTIHHIISDGWAVGVLARELSAVYNAMCADERWVLPELPIQYGDFAAWQRERLQGAELQRRVNYWRDRLENIRDLDLPLDFPRPPVRTSRGARQPLSVAAGVVSNLRGIARSERTTVFTTLLAAYAVLLHRYCGHDEITIGSPVANRDRLDTLNIIGVFVNMLIVRLHVNGGMTFRELLTSVRNIWLEAYEYQDVPYELLVEVLAPVHDLSRNPLFQVTFSFDEAVAPELQLAGVQLAPLELDAVPVRFELELHMRENGDVLQGEFFYSTDLWRADTIARMAANLDVILEELAAQPDRTIAAVPLLPAAEQQQMATWNATATSFGRWSSVHELFNEQVQAHPDAIAVSCSDRRHTYSELDRRANQLAHWLRRHGVGPEVFVGLCVERSIDLVSSVLAIFKAGGVFVPLDPSYPAERLRFMLEDSRAAFVVTVDRLRYLVGGQVPVICLDSDREVIAQGEDADPAVRIWPHNAAYVIYTSGSTGTPKGVVVEHHNLVNTLLASRKQFGFSALDTMWSAAAFSFDIFLWECLNPLVSGGTCLLLTTEEILDTEQLVSALDRVTCFLAVPVLMRQIVSAVLERPARQRPNLRIVFTGGDSVPPKILVDMRRAFPSAELQVLYGPTETTLICTSYRAVEGLHSDRQIIGQPLANMTIRIGDPHGHPVPIGSTGEICVGGDCVSRGYWSRPELTADRYRCMEGRRFYRTGDLGRYMADGNIEFLGRADHQVKIRGFRIELEEVEAVLVSHEGIEAAVASVATDSLGEKRLVSYIVPKASSQETGGVEFNTDQLRAYLGARLPEHMIPSAFMTLPELPLGPNGKLERRKLPLFRPEAPSPKVSCPPADDIEEKICQVWQELLGFDQIGVFDNFFDLGAHSLLMIEARNRLERVLQMPLPIVLLFQYPNVRALAEHLKRLHERPRAAAVGRARADVRRSLIKRRR